MAAPSGVGSSPAGAVAGGAGGITLSPRSNLGRRTTFISFMPAVTVRVPASVSNLGPGFDCLGVALRLYNVVRVERTTKQQSLPIVFEEAAKLFFKRARVRRFPFSCSVREKIPR